jgi:hypothetical protein
MAALFRPRLQHHVGQHHPADSTDRPAVCRRRRSERASVDSRRGRSVPCLLAAAAEHRPEEDSHGPASLACSFSSRRGRPSGVPRLALESRKRRRVISPCPPPPFEPLLHCSRVIPGRTSQGSGLLASRMALVLLRRPTVGIVAGLLGRGAACLRARAIATGRGRETKASAVRRVPAPRRFFRASSGLALDLR